MKAETITIDGENILRTGIYYTNREWLTLSATDESRDIAGMHARYVSPTYARVRTITLEGIIDREESDREALDHLRYLFRLQGSHTASVESREVIITDEYGDMWKIRAKVKDPLEILEGNEDFRGWYYRWRVVLESVGGVDYESVAEIRSPSVWYGTEGLYGWVKFGTKLGKKWNASIASIVINTISDTPLKIILEATSSVDAPIILTNSQTGASFTLNTSLSVGDTLIIDSRELSVKKNGADITNTRQLGSIFPTANGKTHIIITDADGRLRSDDIRVHALYHKILL